MINNGLQIFENPEFGKIRVVGIDGEPWWVLADVCDVLGLTSPHKVAERLDKDERNQIPVIDSVGRSQNTWVTNESGLYSVILRSNKPAAKPFMKWVNEEVLPEIHKQNIPEPIATEGLTALNYKGNDVRMQMIDGEPWWVLADICRVLELSNPSMIAGRLDDDEKNTLSLAEGIPDGHRRGNPNVTIVNEPGLYNVILRSDKPEAKDFKRWVTHEVLPSIRKYGGYIAGQAEMTNEELLAKAFLLVYNQVQDRDKRISELEETAKLNEPKVIFADAVSDCKTCILVGELAKILKQNGVDIGQNRLYDNLRSNGFLISRDGRDRNMPTQKSMEMGLFRIQETTVTTPEGRKFISKTPLVTGKGQQYFVNKFLKQKKQE